MSSAGVGPESDPESGLATAAERPDERAGDARPSLSNPANGLIARFKLAIKVFQQGYELASVEETHARVQGPVCPEVVELLKLEYARAADRYENIYKAIWQNFSYLAVLAAGILTFGAKQAPIGIVIWFALLPLVFWFLATFIPMDHYGDATRKRLRAIEDQLNEMFFVTSGLPGLSHFSAFVDATPKWHVHTAVRIVGTVATLVLIGLSVGLATSVHNGIGWVELFRIVTRVPVQSPSAAVIAG